MPLIPKSHNFLGIKESEKRFKTTAPILESKNKGKQNDLSS